MTDDLKKDLSPSPDEDAAQEAPPEQEEPCPGDPADGLEGHEASTSDSEDSDISENEEDRQDQGKSDSDEDPEGVFQGPPDDEQAISVVECLLFASNEPLSARRIGKILGNMAPAKVREIVEQLQKDYDETGRGVQILELAGGWQMGTRKDYAQYVMQLKKSRKRGPLSNAALETLAIIAYKQPIIRAEVEAIRGVDSSGMIRALQDLGVIRVVGKKEVIGRPSMYGTTEEFLKIFGLRRISDLPSIEQLREQFNINSGQ